MIEGGAGVAVAVGVRGAIAAERSPSTIRPHAPAAKHAIAMNRLISRKKAWRSCLRSSCLLTRLSVQHRGKKTRPFIDLLRKRRNQVPKKLFLSPGVSKTVQPFRNGLISMIVIAIRACFLQTSIYVHLNVSEHENGQLTLAKRTCATELPQMFWERLRP